MEYTASTAATRHASLVLWWGLLILRLTGCAGQQGTNCPVYVAAGGTLSCSCTYISQTPPVQLPSFSWPGYSTNGQLRVTPVVSELNGTTYECVMTMGGKNSSIFYTLLVAYGPSDADLSIIGPETIDPGNSVTLTCLAANVNPEPRYSWTGINCSSTSHANECTFVPTASDDGRVVTCVAKNLYASNTGQTAQKTFTLKLEASTQPSTAPPTTTPLPTTTTTTTTTAEETTPAPQTTSPATPDTVTSPTSQPETTTSSDSSSAGASTPPPATTTAANTTSASSSALASTEPDSTASEPSVVESSTASEQSSTETSSAGTTEEPAPAAYKFPLAVFLGSLLGVFLFILITIVVAVICKRKKERDISLVNGGNAGDGSYKHESTKEYYAFENNGYNKPEMREIESANVSPLSAQLDSHPKETLYPEHPLGYYSSVPTETQEASVRVDEDGTDYPIQSFPATPPSPSVPHSSFPAHPSQATPSEGQEVSMAFDDEQEDEGERQ